MPFFSKHADHRHRHVLDEHGRADRVGEFSEQLIGRRLSQQAHRCAFTVFVVGEATAREHGPIAYLQVAARDPLHARTPVLVAIHELRILSADVTDIGDRAVLLKNRFNVANPEARGASESRAHAVGSCASGQNDQQIGAQALQLCFDCGACPFADRDHRDQRGDTDENPQHRQPGAQLVSSNGAQCRHDGHPAQRRRLIDPGVEPAGERALPIG